MDPRIEAARHGLVAPAGPRPHPGHPPLVGPVGTRPAGAPDPTRGPGAGAPQAAGGFDAVLRRTLGGLVFSQHAQDRLRARRIALGPEELNRLASGVERAAAKGARDSLVLLDRMAFIVSVRNRTVITALDGERMKASVFTNIDSAVIV